MNSGNQSPMDLRDRVHTEASLYRDIYALAFQVRMQNKTAPLPDLAARAAVDAYRTWLTDEGYVDLEATE